MAVMSVEVHVGLYHSLGMNNRELVEYLSEINGIIIIERSLKRLLIGVGLF